jgi:hypothetical protein
VTVLRIPWCEPHTVGPEQLQQYISMLEHACEQHPRNADFQTCLGLAHEMNCDVHRSMDALHEARRIEPGNFFTQLKFAELHWSVGALDRAEKETLKAADLAGDAWELSLAREQLAEVRNLQGKHTQKLPPTRSLTVPAAIVLLMTLIGGILLAWK